MSNQGCCGRIRKALVELCPGSFCGRPRQPSAVWCRAPVPGLCRRPRVSVIVLAHNHEATLARALDGILSQNCPFEVEILVGDDCSHDGTWDVVREYQERYPQSFVCFRASANVGYQANRDNLHRSARGEYLAYCEGDDYWIRTDKLASQVALLDQDREAVGCVGNFLIESEGRRRSAYGDGTLPDRFERNRVGPRYFHTTTYLFRRALLTRIHALCPDLPVWMDVQIVSAANFLGPLRVWQGTGSVKCETGRGLYTHRTEIEKARWAVWFPCQLALTARNADFRKLMAFRTFCFLKPKGLAIGLWAVSAPQVGALAEALLGWLNWWRWPVSVWRLAEWRRMAARLNAHDRDLGRARVCVYTCVVGSYDVLRPQACRYPGAPYVCFTENRSWIEAGTVNGWTIRPLAFHLDDPVKTSRWHKLHPHLLFPEFEESLWIDGSIEAAGPDLVRRARRLGPPFVAMTHPVRRCVFEEGSAIVSLKKDSAAHVRAALAFLLAQNMPEDYGLNETGVIYRRHHDPLVVSMMESWWELVARYSKRDQLFLSYVLWRRGLEPAQVALPNRTGYCVWKHAAQVPPVCSKRARAILPRVTRTATHAVFEFLGLRASFRLRVKTDRPVLPIRIPRSRLLALRPAGRRPDLPFPVIVSMTSFPAHVHLASSAVYSLLSQTVRPERVVLWLARPQFPGGEEDLPDELRILCDRGLEIAWCDEDLRSYKKFVPAIERWPEAGLVTADDDLFYPVDWLEKLVRAYREDSSAVVAHRVHRVSLEAGRTLLPYQMWPKAVSAAQAPSFLNFPTTGGGVLLPPGLLDGSDLDVCAFMSLCPTADDVWLWGRLVRKGVRVRNVPDGYPMVIPVDPGINASCTSLNALNTIRAKNDLQLLRLMARYPEVGLRLTPGIGPASPPDTPARA